MIVLRKGVKFMKNYVSTQLQKLIDALCFERSIQISIDFLYDFYKTDNHLDINKNNSFRSCDYCSLIKSNNDGKSKCMKIKNIAIDKALESSSIYYSTCYMGVTEIKVPVWFNGQPVAIVGLGGIAVKDNISKKWHTIEKNATKLRLDIDKIKKYYHNLELTNKSELENYIKMAQTVANFITATLNSDKNKYTSLISNTKRGNDNYIIYKVSSYIENNYFDDLKLEEIAKTYYINPQYLSRLFKSIMGTNFSEYLSNTRIERAKILLKETNLKNSMIAYQTGFNSVNYFINCFKKKTGMSPKEYRAKHI